jgi:hypothetical protein
MPLERRRITYHDASYRLNPKSKGIHVHEQQSPGALSHRVSKVSS